MNVSLTPELEAYIADKVKSGLYHSSSEVVREGLRLLTEQDALREVRLAALRREVEEGEKQIAAGQFKEYASGEEAMDAVMQKASARRAKRKNGVAA